MAMSITWKKYHDWLLNQEFGWDQSSYSVVHPVVALALHITADMVCESVKKMKSGEAAGPSGIVSEW